MMENFTHTIPRYNWLMTDRFLKSLDYLEGRDYSVKHTATTATLTFNYSFQWDRYWSQWGKHIVTAQ
jgi:hypothetical protein